MKRLLLALGSLAPLAAPDFAAAEAVCLSEHATLCQAPGRGFGFDLIRQQGPGQLKEDHGQRIHVSGLDFSPRAFQETQPLPPEE